MYSLCNICISDVMSGNKTSFVYKGDCHIFFKEQLRNNLFFLFGAKAYYLRVLNVFNEPKEKTKITRLHNGKTRFFDIIHCSSSWVRYIIYILYA